MSQHVAHEQLQGSVLQTAMLQTSVLHIGMLWCTPKCYRHGDVMRALA